MKSLLAALLTAYLLPASGVLKRVANRRDDLTLTSLKMDGSATLAPVLAKELAGRFDAEWVSGDLPLTAALWVRMPGRCRLEITSPTAPQPFAAIVTSGKKRTEGGELPAASAALEALCGTLALHSGNEGESRSALERLLSQLKVDLRRVALGRLGGSVAFILGEGDDTKPQFWVYKDQFLPARVRFGSELGSWDIHFLDYTSQATGDWWPRVVEVYQGRELQLRISVLSAEAAANLKDIRF